MYVAPLSGDVIGFVTWYRSPGRNLSFRVSVPISVSDLLVRSGIKGSRSRSWPRYRCSVFGYRSAGHMVSGLVDIPASSLRCGTECIEHLYLCAYSHAARYCCTTELQPQAIFLAGMARIANANESLALHHVAVTPTPENY